MKIGTGEVLEVLADEETARFTYPHAGVGALGTERGNLPLESIDVRSAVTGLAVRTELAQGFRNPYDVPLEATYIFPLPDRAAVTRLRMEADDRVIEGIVKEREEARADYDRALSEGKRASIAEEERPGVFTMRVGNILPGERIVIRLTLAGRLPFEDGEATYRFPLVVAPRYIPGAALSGDNVGSGTATDTDAVPDASRISPPVLLPGFPNPVRLSAEVEIDPAGLPLAGVRSSLHGVAVTEPDGGKGSGRVIARLHPGERADRDFILRLGYGVEDSVSTSLAVCTDSTDSTDSDNSDSENGTFLLTVLPPKSTSQGTKPRDVVLVLDRSGSMEGWKMVAARRAAARIVDTLTTTDRFAVLAFDSVVETAPELPSGLADATDRHRFRAVEHLAGTEARGGTEMAEPLRQAADLLAASGGEARDRVLVLVTDGQVGNEDQILASLEPRLAGIRIHTIGIDRAVNEGFLRRLADLGGGRYELVESEDRLDEVMAQIHRRIGSPVVTGLRLAPEGWTVALETVTPARLPDLFTGAPLVVSGRFSGKPEGTLTVSGDTADGKPWQTTVPATPALDADLAAFWARGRIRDLEDRYVVGRGNHTTIEKEIVATSLKFQVLCRFTAFVAVDSRVVNQGGDMRGVTQPVDLPDGWSDQFSALPAPSMRPPAPAPAASGPMLGGAAPAAPGAYIPFSGGGPGGPPPAPMARSARSRSADYIDAGEAVLDTVSTRGVRTVPTEQLKMTKEAAAPKPAPPAQEPTSAPVEDVRTVATALLARLEAEAAKPIADRIAVLASLVEPLTELLGRVDREDRQALAELLAELDGPEPGPTELEQRWQKAHDMLSKLSGKRARPFWKRGG